VSGILYKEMIRQGMVKSRNEAHRHVRNRAVKLKLPGAATFSYVADLDDLDIPGKTQVKCGYRTIEVPVTSPEGPDGYIHVSLADVAATTEEMAESGATQAWDPVRGEVVTINGRG
jgi:hypothetical protein